MTSDEKKQYQTPSEQQAALIYRLLSPEFPGCRELRHQAAVAKVVTVVSRGSPAIVFAPGLGPRADEVDVRIPVEAVGNDTDGGAIHILLHVLESYLAEIEMYREDGEPVLQLPDVHTLTVSLNRR